MITLYLIRHGETTWNVDGRFQGQRDSPLNDLGVAQARLVAAALGDRPLDAVYTSDLDRAAMTAALIAAPHDLTPIADIRLREVCFGEWEGYLISEVRERWPEAYAAWRKDSLHTRPPGGETVEAVQARVTDFLRMVLDTYQQGQVAIVGHGGSLRALITLALGADLSVFRRFRLDNCSLSTLEVTDGQFTLLRLNDICHLTTTMPPATSVGGGDQWRAALQP